MPSTYEAETAAYLRRSQTAVHGLARGQHPGLLLEHWLAERSPHRLTHPSGKEPQILFAERIGVPPPNINDLIKGKRDVTVASSLPLEYGTGISAESWLSLQNDHDLARVRAVGSKPTYIVEVEHHRGNRLDDRQPGFYWTLDVAGHKLDGVCEILFDVPADAQAMLMDATGLAYWEFTLGTSIDGGEPVAGENTTSRPRLMRDVANWRKRIDDIEATGC